MPDYWLNKTNNFSYRYERLLHLSDAPGAYFCFWDANNVENKNYIQDGATVYVGIGVQDRFHPESINWRSIATDTGFYLLTISGWKPDSQDNGGQPLKFIYKPKYIIEEEPKN